jgi:hypothetical protein
MLAAAIIVVAGDCALAPLLIWPPGMMGGDNPILFGLPATLVQGVSGLVLGLGGLIWMVRIFRASDDPPPWRYRDR